MAYKLLSSTLGNSIKNLDTGEVFPVAPGNPAYDIYAEWVAGGGVPEAADVPTAAQVAKALEIAEARPIAKAFYDANPAVKAFIRDKTPAQRKAEINAMSNTQLRVVVSYLVEAVICVIKERYLD